jgi:hypothetical protein
MLGPDNAVWDDGEWIGWDEINLSLAEQELRAKYPQADVTLVPLPGRTRWSSPNATTAIPAATCRFTATSASCSAPSCTASSCTGTTRTGSDGRLGNDFVEVKAITPFKACDEVTVRLDRHFNKLLIVKVDENFRGVRALAGPEGIARSEG